MKRSSDYKIICDRNCLSGNDGCKYRNCGTGASNRKTVRGKGTARAAKGKDAQPRADQTVESLEGIREQFDTCLVSVPKPPLWQCVPHLLAASAGQRPEPRINHTPLASALQHTTLFSHLKSLASMNL